MSKNLVTLLDENTLEGVIGEKQRILGAINKAVSIVPYSPEEKYILEAISELTKDYILASVNEKYRIIPDEAFKLKKQLYVEVPHRNVNGKDVIHKGYIEVPLFAYIKNLDEDDLQYRFIGKLNNKGFLKDNKDVNIRLTANLPGGLNEGIKKSGLEALSYVHGVLQEAYKTKPIGDILFSRGTEIKEPKLGVLWVPYKYDVQVIVDDSVVRDPDPALVLDWYKKFLVTLWNVDDEEPLKHYLAKFLE